MKIKILSDRRNIIKKDTIMEIDELLNEYKKKISSMDVLVFECNTIYEQVKRVSLEWGLQLVVMENNTADKNIYISLPIKGYDIQERKDEALRAMFRISRIMGYRNPIKLINIISPFEINNHVDIDDYARQMGNDIAAIINGDVVYFCKGWQNSQGCQAEYEVAKIYGKEIIIE